MMLFLADVHVKVNRRILLCKSGGGWEKRGSEDPPLEDRMGDMKSPRLVGRPERYRNPGTMRPRRIRA
jgi:hypothetical protein